MPATLNTIEEFLLKARRRLMDENPDYSDMDDEPDPEELDPEEGEGSEEDAADEWLKEHDAGENSPEESEEAAEPESEEEAADTASTPEPAPVVKPAQASPKPTSTKFTQKKAEASPVFNEDMQPTREELQQMREYTRPWEARARDRAKLVAEPHVNPIKHHQGQLLESRNISHADRQKAYEAVANSPEFQNADPITQMEMESKFHDDWNKQNPEHLSNALTSHHETHKKAGQAMQAYQQAKDDKIRHIASGGAQPGAMSLEEGLQHAGGSREDEDSAPSGIQQDKGAAFSAGNQDFINEYMKNYDQKSKKFSNVTDMDEYDPSTRADVNTVLGDQPAFKDPSKKRQFDRFVAKYHPLIGKAARQVLSKLNLTDKANRGELDHGLLHEAGMHALFQAVNDYDHDHPSQAKFTTHLTRKMHGLMQAALKTQDEIPGALRSGAKRFDQQRRAENASPVKHTNQEGVTSTIQPPKPPKRPSAEIAAEHHPDVQDRLRRVVAAKAPVVRRQAAQAPNPVGPKRIVSQAIPDDNGGEE